MFKEKKKCEIELNDKMNFKREREIKDTGQPS